MKKQWTLGFLVLLTAVVVGGYFLFSKKEVGSASNLATQIPQATSEEVNIEANFDIYTNGTKRVFTSSMYHNLSSDVFIESGRPNTVQVRKEGVTWNNFFETLPMELTKDCLVTGTKQTFCTGNDGVLKFYINDIEDKDALDKQIRKGDNLLVKYI